MYCMVSVILLVRCRTSDGLYVRSEGKGSIAIVMDLFPIQKRVSVNREISR